MCIFAQHNVLNDPPFSQMDLICCRNLLIYLEPVLQNKVISLFHYAIAPTDIWCWGLRRAWAPRPICSRPRTARSRFFRRKRRAARQVVSFSLNRRGGSRRYAGRSPAQSHLLDIGVELCEAQKEFDRRLVTQFVPATVFVNEIWRSCIRAGT